MICIAIPIYLFPYICRMLQKGNKKLINAWTFYDWANSVYPLIITTAVFPLYFLSVTGGDDNPIMFLGQHFTNTEIYSYTMSGAFLLVAVMSPILSSIADYLGNKKKFLKFFLYLGSLSVMALYFFDSRERLWVGVIAALLGAIGFWGSLVFYNAYLPEIAHPEQQDEVSAKGFIKGYIGSVLLLILILSAILHPEWYGFIDHPLGEGESAPLIVYKISFLTVGIWWWGFAQYTLKYLPYNIHKRKPDKDYIFKGYRELRQVLRELKDYYTLKIFLVSFFLFSAGIQTIIVLASTFGKKELGLPTGKLIITILLVQLLAVLGAYLFAFISKKTGNIKALMISLTIWIIVTFAAFFLPKDSPNTDLYFYTLGGLIGLVLGATQTLARSTYSKLMPEENRDTATYFSFFDVTEKIAIVIGTSMFGFLVGITHSMRTSVLVLAVFFLAGLITLLFMKRTKYVQ